MTVFHNHCQQSFGAFHHLLVKCPNVEMYFVSTSMIQEATFNNEVGFNASLEKSIKKRKLGEEPCC